MSITKCLSRKNSRALIKYLLDGKAHDQTVTEFRNLAVSGHNLMATKGLFNQQIVDKTYLWPFVANQFKATQQMSYAASKGRKKSIEAYHMIFSFSTDEFPLKGDQTKEAQQVVKLVGGYLNQRLPKDSQWIMAVQRDGKGHKLHAHVALNSVQITGKTIQKQYVSWRDLVYQKDGQPVRQQGLASTFDDYLTKNFEKVTQRPYAPVKASRVNRVHSSEEQIIARGGYDWRQDLKNRLTSAMKDQSVHDLSTFEAACLSRGVTVIRKKRGIGKDGQGHKVYKVGYTYQFTGKDKYKSGKNKGQPRVHKMRDYRMSADGHTLAKGALGAAFTPEAILREIQNNEYIKEESAKTTEHAGLHQDVQGKAHDDAANQAVVETNKPANHSGNQTGDENDEPRIEPTGTTNEAKSATTVESESDSSYSSSRNRSAFTPIRHLRKVDWSVFDPDADSRERTRRKQQERDKRLNEFKRRAEAIAEHNREVARRANHIKSRNPYGPNRFHGVWGRLWNSIFFTDLIDEIKQIFGFNAQSGRFDQKYAQPRPTTTNHRKRSQIDKSEHVEGDGPDLL